VQEDIGEDEGDEGDRHGVELALLGFNCQAANRPLIPYDQPLVLRGNIGGGRYWFGGATSLCWPSPYDRGSQETPNIFCVGPLSASNI
jgi:hypothetical protein